MQAAALHGALHAPGVTSGGARGRIASLRVTAAAVERLDDPAIGVLTVIARRKAAALGGLLYDFELRAEDGRELLRGTGTVALLPSEPAR